MAENPQKNQREGLSGAATRSVEVAQAGTRNFLKGLAWILPVFILGVFLYMLFIGSDERRRFTTPEETISGYTEFVNSYVGPGSRHPDFQTVKDWLTFFDSDSRDFFSENFSRIARMKYQFELDEFDGLSKQAQRNDAMAYLLNKIPLNGAVGIVEQRPVKDGVLDVVITNRSMGKSSFRMEKKGGLWYIKQLGGLLPVVTKEIEKFEKYNPPKK